MENFHLISLPTNNIKKIALGRATTTELEPCTEWMLCGEMEVVEGPVDSQVGNVSLKRAMILTYIF